MKINPLRVKITTAPVAEPLTTAEAKTHLRIDHSDEDTYIDSLIETARIYCEEIAQRAFITRTFTAKLDCFPADEFELPFPLLIGVTSIKYTDIDGNQSTYSSANYIVDTHREPGRVALKTNSAWPSVTLQEINGVEIVWTAGYGSAGSAVPERYRQAILLMIGHYYENREAIMVAQGVNMAVLPLALDTLLLGDRGGWN